MSKARRRVVQRHSLSAARVLKSECQKSESIKPLKDGIPINRSYQIKQLAEDTRNSIIEASLARNVGQKKSAWEIGNGPS